MRIAHQAQLIVGILLMSDLIASTRGLAAASSGNAAKSWASNTQMTRAEQKAFGEELRNLARSGDEASFTKLAQYALDQSPEMRKQAAAALGWSKNKEAMDILIALAHDGNQDVR